MRRADRLWFMAFILVLLALDVSALGLSPARKTIQFEPGSEEEVTLRIINNNHKDQNLVVYASGDLAKYVTIDDQQLRLAAADTSTTLTYHVKLPDSFEKRGEQLGKIVVTAVPDGFKTDSDYLVKVTSAVSSELVVIVPYAGMYIEPTTFVSGTGMGDPIRLTVAVKNLGTMDIHSLSAHIKVYNPSEILMAELDTPTISLETGSEGKVEATLNGVLDEGIYRAVFELEYDGESAVLETLFMVGAINVEIISVAVEDFKLGNINKIDILVQNTWNRRIEGIHGEGMIRDKENKNVGNFKTPSANIDPRQIVALEGFWDTKGILSGFYTLDVVLYYANKVSRKSFELEVSLNSVKSSVDISGKVVGLEESEGKTENLLILIFIMVGAVLLVNIIIVIYFVRQRKGKK